MNYEKIYKDFYSKYYDKTEFLIKRFLIKRQSQNKTFTNAINEVTHYLNNYSVNKSPVSKNDNLKKLHHFFDNRYSIYATNHVQEIFYNEIKTGFDRLIISEFPKEYSYTKFIKEIALLEALSEISRLLSNNFRLYEMIYKLNEFNIFEVREHENLALEDYPIYKKLKLKLYPDEQDNNFGLHGTLNIKESLEDKTNFYPLLFTNSKVYDCFTQYQKHVIDFYSDYSYLKKRLEKEKLIYKHTDNDFMKIIYEDMKLISEKNYNEYYINNKLKSLEKSYSVHRENNFNIVFESLL